MQPTYYMWLPDNRWRQISQRSYDVMLSRHSKVKTGAELREMAGVVYEHAPPGRVSKSKKPAGKVVSI